MKSETVESLKSRVESHDTIVLRDSIYIREFIKGDTSYITRVEYRDRWRTQIVHDTVLKTDSIVQVIEYPPERYVPKFHKWCTGILIVIVALFLIYISVKSRHIT